MCCRESQSNAWFEKAFLGLWHWSGDLQGKDAAGQGAGRTAPRAAECASVSCNPVSVDTSALVSSQVKAAQAPVGGCFGPVRHQLCLPLTPAAP